MPDRAQAPASNELEISIIGPGRGECILIHLGNNDWCVVDSCVARGIQDSVATEYLRSFGGSPQIRLVVASHWHDDHIRGLAGVLESAPTAQFSCSMALKEQEFAALMRLQELSIVDNSGTREFARILDVLKDRPGASEVSAPFFALQGRVLLRLSASPARSTAAAVTALSPSDDSVVRAMNDLRKLMPTAGMPQGRLVSPTPNHNSVVLWVEAGARRVLLGADLEHTGRSGEGWLAVISGHIDTTRAEVFKVPHPGSPTSDYPGVWSSMLNENPIAILTPFSGKLPATSDLERIATYTNNLYCTSSGTGKPPTRDKTVEKKMRDAASARRVLDGNPGHVRLRWPIATDQAPSVELFNGAYRFQP